MADPTDEALRDIARRFKLKALGLSAKERAAFKYATYQFGPWYLGLFFHGPASMPANLWVLEARMPLFSHCSWAQLLPSTRVHLERLIAALCGDSQLERPLGELQGYNKIWVTWIATRAEIADMPVLAEVPVDPLIKAAKAFKAKQPS